jgi:hypothetical protein
MTGIKTMDQADAAAEARFREAAEAYREDLHDQWAEALPGNHSPAQALLLAHLLTGHDGYNDFVWRGEWTNRATAGWHTSLFYLADPFPGMLFSFALESRLEDDARQLAIVIEHHRPGERSVERMAQDNALSAKGWRVFVVSETEVLADPAEVRQRIESIAFRMAEELIAAARSAPHP